MSKLYQIDFDSYFLKPHFNVQVRGPYNFGSDFDSTPFTFDLVKSQRCKTSQYEFLIGTTQGSLNRATGAPLRQQPDNLFLARGDMSQGFDVHRLRTQGEPIGK
jgi:hypothetical protein